MKNNVLSLFDGMSCGRIALDRAEIPLGTYYASEIDKYAIKVSEANYPDIERLGDVTKWREWTIDWASIDLLIAGSPCQGFSFAGKQLAFDDPRSALFFVFPDILNHIKLVNPDVKFLLENVRMKKEYLAVITEQLGVEPVFINSALVSAQNRQRYYWTNICKIEQPENLRVVLSDILECDFVDREKAHCLDANYFKGGNLKSYFEKHRRQLVFKTVKLNDRIKGVTENSRGIRYNKGYYAKSGISELGRILKEGVEYTDALTTSHMPKLALNNDLQNLQYRKLTPIECERLQTVPDNYTNHVSNTQRYKMLGNGWTVDVIAHIFSAIPRGDRVANISGPCAKQTVNCVIIAENGKRYSGTNYCNNAQPSCPREVGEDYAKCKTICQQSGHAEINALAAAGENARGGRAVLSGHTYVCMDCQHALFAAGIKSISVV